MLRNLKKKINQKSKIISLIISFFGVLSLAFISWWIVMISLAGLGLINHYSEWMNYLLSTKELQKNGFISFMLIFTLIVNIISLTWYIYLSFFLPLYNGKSLFLVFAGAFYFLSFIFRLAFNKIHKQNNKYLNLRKRILIYSGNIIFIGSIVASPILVASSFKKTLDSPTNSYVSAEFSLNPDEHNIIQIFSDGLDSEYLLNNFSNENKRNLKEFTYYKNFITAAYYSANSMPVLSSGKPNFVRSSHKERETLNVFNFTQDGKKPWADKKYQKNMINPIAMGIKDWSSVGYPGNWSGDGNALKLQRPDLNVLNWSKGRDISFSSGDKWISPTVSSYHGFFHSAKKGKRSFSYLQDHITHYPYMTDENGKFSNTDRDATMKALINEIELLKQHLVNIKGNQKNGEANNAWENTSIFVYGDHTSHDRPTNSYLEAEFDSEKAHSALLYKPATSLIKTKISNDVMKINTKNAIYATDLKKLVESDASDVNVNSIIEKDQSSSFGLNRPFLVTPRNSKEYQLVMLKNEILIPIKSFQYNDGYTVDTDNSWLNVSKDMEKLNQIWERSLKWN